MAVEAEKFWADFERETGEKVEARSIGEWYKAEGDQGLWGLVILTDKAFRFKYLPSDNWLLSLFKRADRSDERKEPVEIRIAREDLASVTVPARTFLSRLFGSAFPRIAVASRGDAASGEEPRSYSFSVDPGSGIIAALQEAVPVKD